MQVSSLLNVPMTSTFSMQEKRPELICHIHVVLERVLHVLENY